VNTKSPRKEETNIVVTGFIIGLAAGVVAHLIWWRKKQQQIEKLID
jgi:hypothetical protein